MTPRRESDAIQQWLRAQGLGQYGRLFSDNEIDFETLLELNEDDLRELSLPLGHRKRLLKAIRAERERGAHSAREQSPNQPRPSGEWRHLTVLVVDLIDSTGLSRKLAPEELTRVLGDYHSVCVRSVRRYGGHVARFRGDGILAYFGWPDAFEDNCERAVFAGLDLVRTVKTVASSAGGSLNIRVGIATGQVIIGELIDLEHSEATEAFGTTPTLAARLESIARPDSVVICAETHDLVRNKFECADLGERLLKGFDEPVRAFRVDRNRSLVFNFEARSAVGLTPLVGRNAEISLLHERWLQAGTGEGQVVLLEGEPGIGKSRLVREFWNSLGNYPAAAASFQCSPLHSDSPLYPICKEFGHLVGYTQDDPPEEKLEKLSGEVEATLHGVSGTAYCLSTLFGIEVLPEPGTPALSPERRRATALRLLADYVVECSAPHAALVILEDAHWMDPTTSEFLDILIDRAETCSLLVVLTYRPYFTPPWRGHPHQTTLTPNRLTRTQSAEMIDAIAGANNLSAELKAEITERSDGNPLYVEELTAAVLGSVRARERQSGDAPGQGAAIPSTLHDSLNARIDLLSPASREFIQTCSAVGRRFAYDHIAAIAAAPASTVENLLLELEDAGLLHATGQPPEAEYAFKHALIQDAAYSTMLESERKLRHASCAKALEAHFPTYCSNEPGLLAHHWEAAGLSDAAVPYYLSAAQLSAERSAFTESETYVQKGLALLGGLDKAEERRFLEMQLRATLGRVYMFSRGWANEAVQEQFSRALELHDDDAGAENRVPFEWALSTYHLLRGEVHEAVTGGDRVVGIAERSGSPDLLAVAHSAATIYGFYAGRFTAVIEHMNAAITHYRPHMGADAQKAYGTDRRLQALRGAALSYWCLGDHAKALELDEEQRSVVADTNRVFEYTYALTISCILHSLRRDADRMQRYADLAVDLGHDRGFAFLAANAENFRVLGEALEEPGPSAIGACFRAIRNYQAAGNNMGVSSMLAIVGEIQGKTGAVQDGLSSVAEGLAYVQRSAERFAEADLLRVQGDLLNSMGEPEKAIDSYSRALEVANMQNARSWVLQASIPLAQQHLAERRSTHAIDVLQSVCGSSHAPEQASEDEGIAQALLAEAQLQRRKGHLDA